MADRLLWNVRCTARRSDGGPCRAWSVRGGYVCSAHGGRAPQVRDRAAYRLVRERLWSEMAPEIVAAVREIEARASDPATARADGLAALAEVLPGT